MTYEEYQKTHNLCYFTKEYDEQAFVDLEELLDRLKEDGYPCPAQVQGGESVKMEIDIDSALETIIDCLQDEDFAGEDYDISSKGKSFLRWAFRKYNKDFANNGNYCDSVNVTVPIEMRWEVSE